MLTTLRTGILISKLFSFIVSNTIPMKSRDQMITVYHSSSSRVALRRSFHRKCKSIRKSPTKFDADSFKFFIPSKWTVNQLSAHLRHLIWILTQMQPKLKGPFWTMVITWLVPSSSISRKLLFILAAGCVMCCMHATFLDDGTIEKLLWAGIWSRDWESLAERSGTLSITLLIT